MKLIFYIQISMKVSYKLTLWFLMGMTKNYQSSQNSKFAITLQYLKKEVRDEVNFLHADKHESFLQVDFNTFDIKVSYTVIPSLLMGTIKHSQSTQSKKFVISLQYLKKEVTDGVHFLHAGKHQSFYELILSLMMEVAGDIHRTQNRKFVIFLQYLKEKVFATAFVFYWNAKHSDILRASSHVRCYFFKNCKLA